MNSEEVNISIEIRTMTNFPNYNLLVMQTQETQLSPRSDLIRDGSVFVMERKKIKTFGIENNIL